MNLMVISDTVSPHLYGQLENSDFSPIDAVISCGDLPLDYLEYIVSTLNVPCFFVPGNHDDTYVNNPPPGWIPLDGRIITYNGISLMGFGGSIKYRPNAGSYYYSEFEMKMRLLKLRPKLWFHKKLDILVTHAPSYQLGDLEGPHQGFKVFKKIIEHYKPRYHLHGHVHLNYSQNPRIMNFGKTMIINGYQHHLFEY